MADVDKMSRKEVLQPNKAEKLLYTFVDHAYRKRRKYTFLVISIVLLLLLIWGFNQYLQNENIKQANLFHNAISKLNDTNMSEEERLRQGVLELQKFANTDSVSKLSILAHMESGTIYATQSKFEDSIVQFKKVIEHPKASNYLKNVSRLSLSSLYEQKNDFDRAMEILNSIDNDSWEDLRIRAMARIAISKGEFKKAKDLLEKFIEKFKDSIYLKEAETLLLTL